MKLLRALDLAEASLEAARAAARPMLPVRPGT
jgi:hypothetical protein